MTGQLTAVLGGREGGREGGGEGGGEGGREGGGREGGREREFVQCITCLASNLITYVQYGGP